ncbi:trypsin-like serine protease [Vibrio sp. Of7-15]|uniref:trypsin-like serine protease n=1 Tax=Vibrio sp. Of7-15 TaxID=2724879 RepID=UPI001EF2CB5A|nr:trypsin-like serine protease [Vibrio sp. Of7-15]MCG7497239.1 trypsin-like serine protease [Vibrio sp. Of7-15]
MIKTAGLLVTGVVSLLLSAPIQAQNESEPIVAAEGEAVAQIVNGSIASLSNYPFMARLLSEQRISSGILTFSCGASVLNEQYILTAAHCVDNPSNNQYLAVGVNALKDQDFFSNERVAAKEIYIHPSYDGSSASFLPNDIAIIKLKSALQTVPSSAYVQLADSTDETSYRAGSAAMTVIGYGDTQSGIDASKFLLQTTVNHVDTATCQTVWSGVTDKQICTSGAVGSSGLSNSSCQGDSGGPLLWHDGTNYKQAGIVSFGPLTCGDSSLVAQAAFTEVNDYEAWIASVLAGTVAPSQVVADFNTESNNNGGSGSSMSWWGILFLSGLAWLRRRSG